MTKASPTPHKNVQAYLPEHEAIRKTARDFRVPNPVVVAAMWEAWNRLGEQTQERMLLGAHRRRPNLQGNRVAGGAA
jgi:hypothetical protein